jgi:hypothetical protein
MRLIYEKGKQVGENPKGYHVYLWRHGDVDRYIGRSSDPKRWKFHTKGIADHNMRKVEYFCAHVATEMSCLVIAELLQSEEAAADLEVVEIDRRGLVNIGTGTLLNDRRGSTIYLQRGSHIDSLPVEPLPPENLQPPVCTSSGYGYEVLVPEWPEEIVEGLGPKRSKPRRRLALPSSARRCR